MLSRLECSSFITSLNLTTRTVLVLLGVGKTVLKYFAKDEGMLSFANNKPVKIFSKGAGSNPNLWGVMVRNKLE